MVTSRAERCRVRGQERKRGKVGREERGGRREPEQYEQRYFWKHPQFICPAEFQGMWTATADKSGKAENKLTGPHQPYHILESFQQHGSLHAVLYPQSFPSSCNFGLCFLAAEHSAGHLLSIAPCPFPAGSRERCCPAMHGPGMGPSRLMHRPLFEALLGFWDINPLLFPTPTPTPYLCFL